MTIDQSLLLQARGAHGLEREDARVLVTHTQGAHGLVGEDARVLSNPTKGAHGLARISISGDHHLGGAAARVSGGGTFHSAPSRLAAMDVNLTLKNPNLGLFVVEPDLQKQKEGTASPFPSLQPGQQGNKGDSTTGNKGDSKTSNKKMGNLDPSLGMAALNPGKYDLGNRNMGLVGLGNASQPGLVTEGFVHATSSSR
ncbi:hypothetical protein TorRG33x02_353330 [Trema orientale]|uniref:Uncharacterized protein n=1 Tax=Trema orientale TaxID=63057 RepID=A0A2P5AD22_TREOI|nr:hypothetical protein TorRG33x02_353330 [Trema orientale]